MDNIQKIVDAVNTIELSPEEVEKKNIIKRVEERFVSLCKSNDIKYMSKTYYKYQHVYFNGAIAVLDEVPAKWGVCLMSEREIVEKYD